MSLPAPVRDAVLAALDTRPGRAGAIAEVVPVGGGCISPTARIRTDGGHDFFLKWSGPDLPRELLMVEAHGLRQLADAGAVRVPEVIAVGPPDSGSPWLLLEWLEPGAPSPAAWRRLGRELAELHRVQGQRFGGPGPNFIGSLPQENTPSDDWAAFWRDRRLEPQLRRALEAGLMSDDDRRRFDALYRRLPELLAPGDDDGPSLLHGDLWSGNIHMAADGPPAIIDPSVYHGHREVDLAMAELFGGFGPEFRAAYEESWPLAPGYAHRRPVYQLYYLLVHVNLFGSGYLARTRQALARVGV